MARWDSFWQRQKNDLSQYHWSYLTFNRKDPKKNKKQRRTTFRIRFKRWLQVEYFREQDFERKESIATKSRDDIKYGHCIEGELKDYKYIFRRTHLPV